MHELRISEHNKMSVIAWLILYVYRSHVTHINESCHTYGTSMNESCHTYEWVMLHICRWWNEWKSLVTHMNESFNTYEWVMSHIWMSHVTHMKESRHTYEWVMSYFYTGGGTNARTQNIRETCWIICGCSEISWRGVCVGVCLCVCVCTYIHTRTCMCMYGYARLSTYRFANMHTHVHTRTNIRTHAHVHTNTHRIQERCICAYRYTHMHPHIHIHIFENSHTHLKIYHIWIYARIYFPRTRCVKDPERGVQVHIHTYAPTYTHTYISEFPYIHKDISTHISREPDVWILPIWLTWRLACDMTACVVWIFVRYDSLCDANAYVWHGFFPYEWHDSNSSHMSAMTCRAWHDFLCGMNSCVTWLFARYEFLCVTWFPAHAFLKVMRNIYVAHDFQKENFHEWHDLSCVT